MDRHHSGYDFVALVIDGKHFAEDDIISPGCHDAWEQSCFGFCENYDVNRDSHQGF